MASSGLVFTGVTKYPEFGDETQTKLDKFLMLMSTAFQGGAGLPVSISGGGDGKQRALTSSNKTAGGSVAAGAVGVQFILSSDFAGTINGNSYSGATSAFWSPPPLVNPGDTYPAIPYTISAGSINLDVLT